MRTAALVALVAFASGVSADRLAAFEEPGHFYSASVLLSNIQPPPLTPPEAALVAFCTQLPDEVYELDAATRRLDYFVTFRGQFDTFAAMVTIQQLIHGLTGGDASCIKKAAQDLVRHLFSQLPATPDPARAEQLCALGFALHLYGDSFAHRTLVPPRRGSSHRMYPTKDGHAENGHLPDYVLHEHGLSVEGRRENWRSYLVDGAAMFGAAYSLSSAATAAIDGMRLGPSSYDESDAYGEQWLRTTLGQSMPPPAFDPPLELHSYDHCQDYVDHVLGKGQLAYPTALSCRRSFAAYMQIAAPLIESRAACRTQDEYAIQYPSNSDEVFDLPARRSTRVVGSWFAEGSPIAKNRKP